MDLLTFPEHLLCARPPPYCSCIPSPNQSLREQLGPGWAGICSQGRHLRRSTSEPCSLSLVLSGLAFHCPQFSLNQLEASAHWPPPPGSPPGCSTSIPDAFLPNASHTACHCLFPGPPAHTHANSSRTRWVFPCIPGAAGRRAENLEPVCGFRVGGSATDELGDAAGTHVLCASVSTKRDVHCEDLLACRPSASAEGTNACVFPELSLHHSTRARAGLKPEHRSRPGSSHTDRKTEAQKPEHRAPESVPAELPSTRAKRKPQL